MLTSVLKNTQDAMVDIVGDVIDDAFSNEPYVGTLENGGVEIAPYHDLASLVSRRARRRDRRAARGDHRRRHRGRVARARRLMRAPFGGPSACSCEQNIAAS